MACVGVLTEAFLALPNILHLRSNVSARGRMRAERPHLFSKGVNVIPYQDGEAGKSHVLCYRQQGGVAGSRRQTFVVILRINEPAIP
jgi:hypothetical protein